MDATAVALLIDFENLVLGLASRGPEGAAGGPPPPVDLELLRGLADAHGEVAVARAYADWRRARFNRHQAGLERLGVERVHVPARGQKNAVDVRITVDAMELAYERPDIDTYVLVSGDRDFTHLLAALRRRGRRLIGVAPERAASEELAALCDRFVTCEALWQARRAGPRTAQLDRFEARLALLLTRHVGQTGILAAQLKPLLRERLTPGFDEAEFGYSRLTDLLRAMPSVVRLEARGPDRDVLVRPAVGREEALRLARERGLTGGLGWDGETTEFLRRARKRLAHFRFEWDRAVRRRLLARMHEAMRELSTFTRDELFEALRAGAEASETAPTATELGRYVSVCFQSKVFDIAPDQRALPTRARNLQLRARYATASEFIARYEQSILYKLAELLPDDPTEALRLAALVLTGGEDEGEEVRAYVGALLDRIREV